MSKIVRFGDWQELLKPFSGDREKMQFAIEELFKGKELRFTKKQFGQKLFIH